MTFSLRKRIDIRDAQTGADELRADVLAAPISLMLYKNVSPAIVIPKIPDKASNVKSLLLRFDLDRQALDTRSRKMASTGNRTTFASTTLTYLSPSVTIMVPREYRIELEKASIEPRWVLRSVLLFNVSMTFAIATNIAAVPTKYRR